MKTITFTLNNKITHEEVINKLFEIKDIKISDFKVFNEEKKLHYFIPVEGINCECGTIYDEVKQ